MNNKNVVLLFNVDINNFTKTIPYSLLDLERAIRELNIEVVLIDEQIKKNYKEIIAPYIERILLCCISVENQHILPNIQKHLEFLDYIKATTGCYTVISGFFKAGWVINYHADKVIVKPEIDFIIKGQGEIPLKLLISHLLNCNNDVYNESIKNIPNLLYKINNNIFINNQLKPYKIDNLPNIDLTLIDVEDYYNPAFKSIEYFATYGCPHNCNFCTQASYWEGGFFCKDINVVINEIKHLLDKNQEVIHLSFIDDNMFADKDFALSLADKFIENKIGIKWNGVADINYFLRKYAAEDIIKLKKSGLSSIYAGGESGNQEMLKRWNKKHAVSDIFNFVQLMKTHAINTELSFILLDSVYTKRNLYSTFKLIMKLKLINYELGYIFFLYYNCMMDAEKNIFEIKEIKNINYIKIKNLPIFNEIDDTKYVYEYLKLIKVYGDFYFKFIDFNYYKRFEHISREKKIIIKFINKLWWPFIWLRFKLGIVGFTCDAMIISKIVNRIIEEEKPISTKEYTKFRYTNI